MTDDDLIDLDGDEDGADAEGRAVVLCRVESLGVRFTFTDSVEAALRLAAQPCPTPGCLGHTVVHRDDRGQLRTLPAADGHDLMARRRDVLRTRERRQLFRKRVYDAERQRRRRAANREALEREDDDDGPS
jgi:hypothetical protein